MLYAELWRGWADSDVHAQSVLRADYIYGCEPDGQRADWQWNRPAGAVLIEVVVLMAKRAARPRRVARIRPRKEVDAQHCGEHVPADSGRHHECELLAADEVCSYMGV